MSLVNTSIDSRSLIHSPIAHIADFSLEQSYAVVLQIVERPRSVFMEGKTLSAVRGFELATLTIPTMVEHHCTTATTIEQHENELPMSVLTYETCSEAKEHQTAAICRVFPVTCSAVFCQWRNFGIFCTLTGKSMSPQIETIYAEFDGDFFKQKKVL